MTAVAPSIFMGILRPFRFARAVFDGATDGGVTPGDSAAFRCPVDEGEQSRRAWVDGMKTVAETGNKRAPAVLKGGYFRRRGSRDRAPVICPSFAFAQAAAATAW